MTSKQENQDNESGLNRLVAGKITSHKHTDQDIIVISENTARLLLIEYQNILKSRYEWKVPLGILVSLVPTIVAAEKFHDAFSIPASGWEPILRFVVYASAFWLVVALIKISKTWEMGGIDELINRLEEPDRGHGVRKGVWFTAKNRVAKVIGGR